MRALGYLTLAALSMCVLFGPLILGLVMQRKRWRLALPLAVASYLIPYGTLLAGLGMQAHAYAKGGK